MKVYAERRSIEVDIDKDKFLETMNGALEAMSRNELIVQDLLSMLNMDHAIKHGDDSRHIFDLRFELDHDDEGDTGYKFVIDWYSAIR